MYNRGPGFLAVVQYNLAPSPFSSPVSKLDRDTQDDNLLTGERVGEREGAKSYDGEKAWSSIKKFKTL
jgi:hypothetical protein